MNFSNYCRFQIMSNGKGVEKFVIVIINKNNISIPPCMYDVVVATPD